MRIAEQFRHFTTEDLATTGSILLAESRPLSHPAKQFPVTGINDTDHR
jgi:hypothetical protein